MSGHSQKLPEDRGECMLDGCTNPARGLDKADNRIPAAFCCDDHDIAAELELRDDEFSITPRPEGTEGKVVSIPVSREIHQRVMAIHGKSGYLITDLYRLALEQGIDDVERWYDQFSEYRQ